MQTVADIEQDPHWRARQLHGRRAQRHRSVRMHNVVPRLSATPGEIRWPGGALGEDNDDVYREELGLSCDEIKQLTDDGVI